MAGAWCSPLTTSYCLLSMGLLLYFRSPFGACIVCYGVTCTFPWLYQHVELHAVPYQNILGPNMLCHTCRKRHFVQTLNTAKWLALRSNVYSHSVRNWRRNWSRQVLCSTLCPHTLFFESKRTFRPLRDKEEFQNTRACNVTTRIIMISGITYSCVLREIRGLPRDPSTSAGN